MLITNSIYVCSVCACLDLSVSSSSWGLGRAAVCNCGTPWTFLLPFMYICEITWEKNNLLEEEMKVQIIIRIWPSQISDLAKFLFGLRHTY